MAITACCDMVLSPTVNTASFALCYLDSVSMIQHVFILCICHLGLCCLKYNTTLCEEETQKKSHAHAELEVMTSHDFGLSWSPLVSGGCHMSNGLYVHALPCCVGLSPLCNCQVAGVGVSCTAGYAPQFYYSACR